MSTRLPAPRSRGCGPLGLGCAERWGWGCGVHLAAAVFQDPPARPDPGWGWGAAQPELPAHGLRSSPGLTAAPPDSPGPVLGNEGPGTAQPEGGGPAPTLPASPQSPSARRCHADSAAAVISSGKRSASLMRTFAYITQNLHRCWRSGPSSRFPFSPSCQLPP